MEAFLDEKCFHEFRRLIYELTGITIEQTRTSMVEGRLRKRVKALGLDSYRAYLQLVREAKIEQVHFIDLITTNETYFFRTPRIWDYVENYFLPNWFAAHRRQVFTAWSAAASSGEEAHSLGIICELFKAKNPDFLYQIVGTDISREMVGLGSQGLYSGRSIESFRSSRRALFEKYTVHAGENAFRVIPEIKTRMRFHPHNLFHVYPGKERFDLILIRNVLIYFKREDQEKVLSLIAPRLADDGALIIGESESLSHIKTRFKPIEPLIYRLEVGQAPSKKTA